MALIRDRGCSTRDDSLRCFAKYDAHILCTDRLRCLLDRVTLRDASGVIANSFDRHSLVAGVRTLTKLHSVVSVNGKRLAAGHNCKAGFLLLAVVSEFCCRKCNVFILQADRRHSDLNRSGGLLVIGAAICGYSDRSRSNVLAGYRSVYCNCCHRGVSACKGNGCHSACHIDRRSSADLNAHILRADGLRCFQNLKCLLDRAAIKLASSYYHLRRSGIDIVLVFDRIVGVLHQFRAVISDCDLRCFGSAVVHIGVFRKCDLRLRDGDDVIAGQNMEIGSLHIVISVCDFTPVCGICGYVNRQILTVSDLSSLAVIPFVFKIMIIQRTDKCTKDSIVAFLHLHIDTIRAFVGAFRSYRQFIIHLNMVIKIQLIPICIYDFATVRFIIAANYSYCIIRIV